MCLMLRIGDDVSFGRLLCGNEEMSHNPPPVPQHGSGRDREGPAYWKDYLYRLQGRAPRPVMVRCGRAAVRRPSFYGAEFHGLISREEADTLLIAAGNGAFLVRESQRSSGSYTLCMRYDGNTKNYKLYYDPGTQRHFVGEKRFDNITDLVHDGFICMYMDDIAREYISSMTHAAKYEESPYSQYQRSMTHRPSALARRHDSRASLQSLGSESPAQKEHVFKVQTFRMAFCDYCGNFLWGLVQQGERCQDCGFVCHKKCRDMVLNDCRPDLKYVRRMFGVDVTTLCMAHNCVVPPVVELCVATVEKNALDLEGLYRVSGSHDDMERLKGAFDAGTTPDLEKVEDMHTVAGLLKLYLRQLPLRLIPFHAAKTLESEMRASESEIDRVECLRSCLTQLPRAHVPCLRLLMSHLCTVAKHSPQNRMNSENLARIFAMSIFYCNQDENLKMNPSHVLTSHENERQILVFMIEHWQQIFPDIVSLSS